MPETRHFSPLVVIALTIACTCVWSQTAHADEPSYSSVVVQNRKHFGTHEFGFKAGTLALDAFTKGYTVGGQYTIHFTQTIGWEVVEFHHSFQVDTDLRDELRALEFQPTPFEIIDDYVMSSFVFKPVYWKGSWMNSSVIYGELLFNVGAGYGWFTRSGRPGGNVGMGFRVYGTDILSFRIDARYLAFLNDGILGDFSIEDDLHITLGTSLAFW